MRGRYGGSSVALLLAAGLALIACGPRHAVDTATVVPGPSASLPWIAVSADRRGFVERGSGRRFTPWGFNYDHDDSPALRLLEDYWETEWPRVERDLRAMRAMGATVVRIHLQLERFLEPSASPSTPAELRISERALDRYVRLLRLAAEVGLHLDVTGLASYRPASTPAWLDALPEAERWALHARFWEAIARRSADSPAIFCFNLMNEPAVPGADPPAGWRPPPWLDGRTYVELLARQLGTRSRADVARRWLRAMTSAIRRNDRRHLITVGNFLVGEQARQLPIGLDPAALAAEVDFLSVHLYPKRGQLGAALRQLAELGDRAPIFIEESAPLHCSVEELGQVMRASRGRVAGWLGFFWGRTLAEYGRSTAASDQRMFRWMTLAGRIQRELAGRD
jgi:hypothetical protein